MGLVVRVLGPLEVWRDGAAVPIGGPKARMTLALLVAQRSGVLSTDRLVDALWGDEPPPTAVATTQSNVSRLRRALAPEIEIVTRAPGYVLEATGGCVDADGFETLVRNAGAASPADAVELLERGLGMWRGPAFDEFSELDWARGAAVRLDELRLGAFEDLVEAWLALGALGTAVGELERLVVDQPLRERFWRQLMLALYRSGRQAEALRRANELRRLLREELGLDPSADTLDLERRILADDPTLLRDQPARGASDGDRPYAPIPDATRFVGRDADLESLGRLLERQRLVTLVGPGGVGKTRLALRLAATSDPRGDRGPYLVELAGARDEQGAVQTIAAALDVQQRQHLSLEATLVEFLRDREALIVLDNCEHLVDAIAPFAALLRDTCPGVTVLATSREPLGLAGEHTWQVSPLGIPRPDDRSPDSVGASEAVQLFVDRASAAHPDFALSTDNAAAVAEICRRLDGLPLALELAAARLRTMGPYALAERLRQRSDLLGAQQRGADRRHRTLRDTLEWSYDLLSASEQQMFERLATFVGSFGLRAAEHICTLDDGLDVADLVANLVDKSMLQVLDLDEPRYRLLETLREFGLERLAQRGGGTELRVRHRDWYVGLARDAESGLSGPDEGRWVRRLERDFENLREAHARAVVAGDLECAITLVASLREFAFRSMRYEVTTWAESTTSIPGFDRNPRAPVVIAAAAYGSFVRGDLDRAIEIAERSIEIGVRLGTDSSGLAERTLGNALFYRGNTGTALDWMERMLASARVSGEPARLTHALYMRSVAATSIGDTDLGRLLADEAVEVARESGSPTALAQAAYASGLALESTAPDEGDAHLRRAADVGGAAGNRWINAFAMTEVLWLEARKGDHLTALAGFATVIDTWYRGGDWANQWLSLRHVCGILSQLDAHRAAAVLFGALTAAGAASALPVEPSHAQRLDDLVQDLRGVLGPAGFAAAVAEGAATSDANIVRFVQREIERLGTVDPAPY